MLDGNLWVKIKRYTVIFGTCVSLGVMALVSWVLYDLEPTPELTLEVRERGDDVEFYLIKDKANFFNIELANDPKQTFPFITARLKDGEKRYFAIMAKEKLDLTQSKCSAKWDCPIARMTIAHFDEKYRKRHKLKSYRPEEIIKTAMSRDASGVLK